MTTETINKRLIVDYMCKHNLTKSSFCKLCGITSNSLNKILANDFSVTIAPIFKVSKTINVHLCEMFIKKDES